MNIIERILRHAPRQSDDECWITDYKPHPRGYVVISSGKKGRTSRLHRIAYEAHYAEPIPDGYVICHTCDNPACYNPAHLIAAPQADNVRDAVSKGRMPHLSWSDKRRRA